MKAVVVGLGKIGLPVAVSVAGSGVEVIGCDINPDVVAAVNAGESGMPNETGLSEALSSALSNGLLKASTDTAEAVRSGCDLVIVVPPLVVGEDLAPDWRHIDSALADIGRGLTPGCRTVVSVETTLPVGSTRGRVTGLLEAASGLKGEIDFFVVASPERVFSGRILADLQTYPKLVGGISEEGERLGVELYSAFIGVEVRAMGSAEAAELAKLAETTYRDINIAFANELAVYSDSIGVDVGKVISAANSQPFSHIHSPGISVGGHCIPVYPHFLLWTDQSARLPRVGREINDSMPAYGVELLSRHIELEGARVLILGVTYRGGVDETAFSGAFALRDELITRGARPVASDPLIAAERLESIGFTAWEGGAVSGAILHTDHPEYAQLAAGDIGGASVIVDGRGMIDATAFREAGVAVELIGSPD